MKVCATRSSLLFSLFWTELGKLLQLQALSKRIHYGKYVAEAKFQGAPDTYTPAILNKARIQFSLFLFFWNGTVDSLSDWLELQ
jgi:hypothetical protein